ncbi:hypothetical protein ABGB18_41820 [Nonomuraea sp. B12E4]
MTSSIPGQAQASLIAEYHCTGGVAGDGVDLEAAITPQIEGGLMNVRWNVTYKDPADGFGSPGFSPAGSLLSLDGVVDISGAWNGQLRPQGGKEQEALEEGNILDLPEGLSDQGSIERGGTIRFKPGALFVRFTPAEGEKMVNNDNEAIDYAGSWAEEGTNAPLDDWDNDLHKTSSAGAIAELEFTGTKVAYIGRRAPGLGPVEVFLDGSSKGQIEPGKVGGEEATEIQTQEVLWESGQLAYGPHTIRIENVIEAKDAYLDAFRVTTGGITTPPTHNEATCERTSGPDAIDVTVPGPSETPPTDPPGEEDPGEEDPGEEDPPAEDPTASESASQSSPDTLGHISVVVQGSESPTPRATGPTATRYARAQVANTPQGGVDTGEAPDPVGPPFGFMAGGALLLMGSVGGGLMLRRRTGAHVGGVK